MEDDQPIVFEPPFYLVETETECWKCGKVQTMSALACHPVREEVYDDPAFIKYAEWMPKNLRQEIMDHNPRYGLVKRHTSGRTYYANSCECGAAMGDYDLHDPEGPFSPAGDEGLEKIRVNKLDYSDAFRTIADPSWEQVERILEQVSTD